MWDLGELDPKSLKTEFDELFMDSLSRDWWRELGPTWMARRSRWRDEFLAIAWASHSEADLMAVEAGAPHGKAADPRPDVD